MLVKKKNPEWFPSENKFLKVGETIDITDPKALILNESVVAVNEETGAEISAFELYGVVVKTEMEEFQDYMKLKKAEQEKERLTKERQELEVQKATFDASKTATETATDSTTTATEAKEQTFGERMAAARAAKKAEREAAANAQG